MTRLFLMTMVIVCSLAASSKALAAAIFVGPYTPSTTMPFVVPVQISGAQDLTFFQFDLLYNAADLQIVTNCDPFTDIYCNFGGTGVTEGPFFGSQSPFNVFNPGFILTNTVGTQIGNLLAVNDTFGGPPATPPSGDGILAYVEFVTLVGGSGTSLITVADAANSGAGNVPEPATLSLASSGVLLLVGRMLMLRTRRRRRHPAADGYVAKNPAVPRQPA